MKEVNTVIIDYGMGNLASVHKALNVLGIQNIISNKIEDIVNAKYLILPGVGSYYQGMKNLKDLNLINVLNEEVIGRKKPIFGICLGMQLFSEIGTEPIKCSGLSWVSGKVEKLEISGLRIPHLGWNNIKIYQEDWAEFDEKDFYFIHSYHFAIEDKSKILATVDYGKEVVAAIRVENLMACQFHPEKSQAIGLKFLKSFFEYYA